jgi:dienelactone hydrolase
MVNAVSEQHVTIPTGGVVLRGILTQPEQARAGVIFAHGSGSSRLSPRNKFVADTLAKEGFVTLLFDLLTPDEDADYENRFNIDLLAERLKAATLWLKAHPQTAGLRLGYFGASTGSASALRAAADPATEIKAVVSRGGRPDLAGDALSRVPAPVLLIVGGLDQFVIELNRKAAELIRVDKKVTIVPGATHLFEEPGSLEEVARLASEWFTQYLVEPLKKAA